MTYLLFINGHYFEQTRNSAQAFTWLRDWQEAGHSAGLRFLRDNDEEAFRWLVPAEALEELRRAA